MGRLLAERGIELVYGGASVGLMGALSDAVNERFLRAVTFETLLVERDAASLLDLPADHTVPNTLSPASPKPGRM